MRHLSTLFLLSICVLAPAHVTASIADKLEFEVLSDGGVEVKGFGTTADDTPSEAKEQLTIPSKINLEGKEYQVRGIADRAFVGNINITALSLPENLEWIGVNAFSYCSELTELGKIPLRADIRNGAFSHCASLKAVDLNDFNGLLGDYVFGDCGNLKNVVLNRKMTDIPPLTFCNCVGIEKITMPQKLSSIGASAFAGCAGMKELLLPDELCTINEKSFAGCVNLSKVTFSSSELTISEGGFENCHSLTELYLLGVVDIQDRAFMGCRSLESLEVEACLQIIGANAFSGCESLRKVYAHPDIPPIIMPTSFPSEVQRSAILYVPQDAAYLYEYSPYWQLFSDIVEIEKFPVNVDEIIGESLKYFVADNLLHITSCAPQPIRIYDSAGVLVGTYSGKTGYETALPKKGCYFIVTHEGSMKVWYK